jgi:hypothetical protein
MHLRRSRHRSRLAVGLAVIGLLSAAACGGSSSDDNSFSGDGNEKVDGSGETLTLWIMQGR